MKRFLSILLLGATGSVVLASNNASQGQQTPQVQQNSQTQQGAVVSEGNSSTTTSTQTGAVNAGADVTTQQTSTPTPAPNTSSPRITALKKCKEDFSEEERFARVQCMRYTDLGFTCKKDGEKMEDLSCENKEGLQIYVPTSEIKEEIALKEEAGVLHRKSRLVEAFGHHRKKEEVKSEKESGNLNPTQISPTDSAATTAAVPAANSVPTTDSAATTAAVPTTGSVPAANSAPTPTTGSVPAVGTGTGSVKN